MISIANNRPIGEPPFLSELVEHDLFYILNVSPHRIFRRLRMKALDRCHNPAVTREGLLRTSLHLQGAFPGLAQQIHDDVQHLQDYGVFRSHRHAVVEFRVFLDRDVAIEEDSEFHYSVAMASENTVILKVLDVIMDLLRETRERSLQVEGRPQKSLAGHRRIVAAIKRLHPEAAENAMRRHIQDVEEIVLNKL